MKIDKRLYKYIDFELQCYEKNKKTIKEIELDIIEENSSSINDGQPKGNNNGKPTEIKAMQLISNVVLVKMKKTIDAIDRVYDRLSKDYKEFFDWNYIKRAGIVKTCSEIGIAEKTYYRWRDKIVYLVGEELGLF